MILKDHPTQIQSDAGTLVLYESMRLQVLNMQETYCQRSLGLALFIRQGMLAWTQVCGRCTPAANTKLNKGPQAPTLAYQATSEMIKIMANITLSNLQEARS